jgi:hypothetical protein
VTQRHTQHKDQLRLSGIVPRAPAGPRVKSVPPIGSVPKVPESPEGFDQRYSISCREDISALRIVQNPGKVGQVSIDHHDDFSPTLLAASERVYDAELTRRESINNRCGAVLSTAGILGALVVGAGQLGLMQHEGSLGVVAGIIWLLFGVSLLYLGLSIAMALRVHGGIQDNVVGPGDLMPAGIELNVNGYNVKVAKVQLSYAVENWRLNNDFKFRLNSAQRYLRNGIIAIIVAGILSPLSLGTPATSAASMPQITTRQNNQVSAGHQVSGFPGTTRYGSRPASAAPLLPS